MSSILPKKEHKQVGLRYLSTLGWFFSFIFGRTQVLLKLLTFNITVNYIAKGQTISKANYGVLNSPKKPNVGIILYTEDNSNVNILGELRTQ